MKRVFESAQVEPKWQTVFEKRCPMCGETKPLSFDESESSFRWNERRGKYRPHSRCKACDKLENQGYRKQHSGDLIAASSKWRRDNPERYAELQRRSYQRHREKSKLRVREAEYALQREAYERYGGARCRCCGETEFLFLTLDHVNNDGAAHRRAAKEAKARCSTARWAKKHGWPEIFQVLCMQCNHGRARNGGICPHAATLGMPGPTGFEITEIGPTIYTGRVKSLPIS